MANERPDPTAGESTRGRWIAFGVSSILSACAFVGFVQLRGSETPDLVWVESDEAGARAALEEASSTTSTRPPLPWRYYLPEKVSIKLMPQIVDDLRVYDIWRYFAYPARETLDRRTAHGHLTTEVRTNQLGLRGPDVRHDDVDLRIVVAGDSHVEGHLSKFPELLERRFANLEEFGDVQVVNAAHGAYSLFHYFGTLELFLAKELRPDVFIVSVFAGNDFMDSLMLWDFFAGRKLSRLDQERSRHITNAERAMRHPYGQGLTTVVYFREFPEREASALTCAQELLTQIRERCAEADVELLVVLIPAPLELPGACDWDLVQRTMVYQGLESQDLEVVSRLRTALGDWLRAADIAHVDLLPILGAHGGRRFDATFHIDSTSHRLAADVLFPVLQGMLR